MLVEGLLLVETFLPLGLKIIELPLTNFTKVPPSSHLVDLCLNLKVRVLTKSKVFQKLREESFEFNQVLGHKSRKFVSRKFVKQLEDVDS